MKYSKPIIIASLLLVGGIVGATVLQPSWSKVKADTQTYNESFTANLTPEQEGTSTLSQNNSSATGNAVFNVSSDNTMINYVVTATNLSSAFSAAHLHCAPIGQTGQVIVPLMLSSSITPATTNGTASTTGNDVTLSGSIMESDILPAAMSCNPNIKTLSHLIQAMREGQIYVNIHTQNYPMGEVRGQLMRSDQVIDFNATSTIATSTDTTTATSTATTTDMIATSTDMTATSTDNSTGSTTTSTDTSGNQGTTTVINNPSPSGWDYVFVQPDAYYKIQGSSIQFTGSHFMPGETVTISLPHTTVSTATADSSGNFTSSWITVPYNIGQRVFTFTGNQSQIPFPVYVQVGSGSPWIELSSYYAPAGSSVTISGHQFGGNENVNVMWSGANVGTAHTDSNGNFTFTTNVPSSSASQTTISASGAETNLSASQPFSLQQ